MAADRGEAPIERRVGDLERRVGMLPIAFTLIYAPGGVLLCAGLAFLLGRQSDQVGAALLGGGVALLTSAAGAAWLTRPPGRARP